MTRVEAGRGIPAATERTRATPPVALLALLIGGAVALRVWVLASPLGRVDADEATVGLMARDFGRGHFTAFFWGQRHGGTLEPAVGALLFRIAGPSAFVLKSVPLLLCAVAAVLVWRIAIRISGAPNAGLAGALFTVFPPAFVWWSTKERGFYWAALVLVLATFLLALRLHDRFADGGKRPTLGLFALGVCVGLAWWTSPQTVYVLLPLLVWFAIVERARWRDGWLVGVGAVLGATPWLRWNSQHGFKSLDEATPVIASTYAGRVRGFFTELLPMLLGLRMPYSGRWLFGPLGVVAYLVVLGAFAVWTMRVLRDPARRTRLAPLLAVALAYPFLFAIPGASAFTREPRYGLMLAPFIVLLGWEVVRARSRAVNAVAVVAVTLAFITTAALVVYADDHPGAADLAPPDASQLRAELDRLGVSRAYGDYWLAYPTTFDARERVVVTPVDFVRAVPLHQQVDATAPSTYVVFADGLRDEAIARTLRNWNVPFERTAVGRFAVYQLDRRVLPKHLTAVWRLPD